MTECLFCNIPSERVIKENELAYAIFDGFPVTDKHALIIPKRHALNYFELTKDEIDACNGLLFELKSSVESDDEHVCLWGGSRAVVDVPLHYQGVLTKNGARDFDVVEDQVFIMQW